MLIPARHLAFTTPLVEEFLTPLNPHVQIPELEACLWILPIADQRCSAVA